MYRKLQFLKGLPFNDQNVLIIIITLWDIKEPKDYSQNEGLGVPIVVVCPL